VWRSSDLFARWGKRMRPITALRLITLVTMSLLIADYVSTFGEARAFTLLTQHEKATIRAADNAPGPTCYDFNESNCSGLGSDGSLTACATKYSGPCTGSCKGACSEIGAASYTTQTGSALSQKPTFTNGTDTCGFVKTGGACTSIPNGSPSPAGAGCYCVGGQAGTTACGKTFSGLPNPMPAECPAIATTETVNP
jgi:hypothetical protein